MLSKQARRGRGSRAARRLRAGELSTSGFYRSISRTLSKSSGGQPPTGRHRRAIALEERVIVADAMFSDSSLRRHDLFSSGVSASNLNWTIVFISPTVVVPRAVRPGA